ncbi:endonuclease/exonuclease/phosphatase family protein [Paraburkholderia bengalensis]|uniref:Endonuclease/exonuclease/phosphatase family protein n=1 Tax=Paraburkholderia bengalensis TaxID=2747562 RepID=A0ABU8J1V0_9BURK
MNAPASTMQARPVSAPARALRIATYNIHDTVGTDGRRSAERIADVIGELDADIVALQEVPLGGSFAPNALPILREATGMDAIAGPTLDTPERRYGNAILSRLPIRATRSLDLSFGTREARGALDVDVSLDAGVGARPAADGAQRALRVVATHLGLTARERRAQIRALIAAFDTPRMPVILMGDLNEWFVWGQALRMLVTHFRAAPAPRTFPSRLPMFALDRIWMHPADRLLDVQVHRSMRARVASDHLPLVARIAWEHYW